jgi:putative transcriptional regulator
MTAEMAEVLTTTMKVERAKRDLTQAELADLAGVTRKSINAIETGHMVPSIVLALKLAHALGVKVEELFALELIPD